MTLDHSTLVYFSYIAKISKKIDINKFLDKKVENFLFFSENHPIKGVCFLVILNSIFKMVNLQQLLSLLEQTLFVLQPSYRDTLSIC